MKLVLRLEFQQAHFLIESFCSKARLGIVELIKDRIQSQIMPGLIIHLAIDRLSLSWISQTIYQTFFCVFLAKERRSIPSLLQLLLEADSRKKFGCPNHHYQS